MTELVFLLDNSGSMHGLESDTIGGFNAMIEKQKKEPEQTLVSVVTFNSVSRVIYDRVPLERIPVMTDKDYRTGGSTALLDAIGDSIRYISHLHKSMPRSQAPEKTIFVITTDGMENSSRKYTYADIRKKIEKRKNKYGWEFLFLGANIDAIAEAGRFGIDADHAANYKCDPAGTALNYEVLSETVADLRRGKRFDASWKTRIDEDYKKRKNS